MSISRRSTHSTRWRVALVAAPAIAALGARPRRGRAVEARTISFAFWGDPAEQRAYERLAKGFQETNPDVSVRLLYTPSPADYRRQVATDFAAGDPPDVFLINYRTFGQYAARGVLEPLDERLAGSDSIKVDDFYQTALDAFRYRGRTLFGLPQNAASVVVYYNQDQFDRYGVPRPRTGWTWDEFAAAARALTLDTNGDGAADRHGVGVEPSFIRYTPFIWMNGGDIVDDLDNPTRLTLDTPEAMEAIEWFVGLGMTGHNVVPTEAEVLAEDDETRFMRGTTAMLLHSRRVVPTLREGIKDFAWDVAPLPVRGEGAAPANLLHSDAFCLAGATDDKEAAWRFIEFAVGEEGQGILARTGRTVPSMIRVAESEAFLSGGIGGLDVGRPFSGEVYLDAIGGVRRVPNISTWPEVEDAFTVGFRRAFYIELDIAGALDMVSFRAKDAFRRADEED
jgi:multiple sugar transport system substrate-binding protein